MDANEGNQRSSVGRKASAGPIRGPGGREWVPQPPAERCCTSKRMTPRNPAFPQKRYNVLIAS